MAKQVSVDGGATLLTAENIDESVLNAKWQPLNNAMDPDVRLTVGGIVLDDHPDDKRLFLREYLDRAPADLVVA